MKILQYIGNALLFNKGYRKAGIIFWILIFAIGGSVSNYLYYLEEDNYYREQENIEAQNDYVLFCSKGDFVSARKVQDKYYDDYCSEYAAWRGGKWNHEEARTAQKKYHSVAAYIFSQEIVSIYYGNDASRESALISRITAIPAEGAPLVEGRHGNGMFYDNDAGISESLAIDHVTYQSWVHFYNDRCEQVLDLALVNGDVELAKKVARLYKAEIITHFEPDTVRGQDYCIAIVSYDQSRREAAIQRTNNQEL